MFTKGQEQTNTGRTHFKPGHIPWNKGIKVTTNSGKTWFKKGDVNLQNDNHHSWKGDDVSYVGLHQWVRRKLGRPEQCSHCDTSYNIQWANKSREYLRDLNDWIPLCRSCHMKYDDIMNKAWRTRKERM